MFFPRHTKSTPAPQSGFTLIELLVVIFLLAVIAGVAVLSYDGVQVQGRDDVTKFEMAEIRKALLQFRRDSGSNDFPNQGTYACSNVLNFPSHTSGLTAVQKQEWCNSPANFWMLFENPLDDLSTTTFVEGSWNIDTNRGWNGPYLQRKSGYLTIDADFESNGVKDSPDSGTFLSEIWGVASAYITEPSLSGDLTWQGELGGVTNDRNGTPYLLFDLDTSTARVVSMGNNHLYDGNNSSDLCRPNADDIVLCLLK